MEEYKKCYFLLFCTITNTIESLEHIIKEFSLQGLPLNALQEEIKTLKLAQQNAEDLFISTSF